MIKYDLGKIYKIVCNITGEIYIGSTIQTLALRLATHKHYNNTCTSKQIIERGDYSIELIENYTCNTRDELHSRERYYIDTLTCINNNKPLTDLERETYARDYRQRRQDYYKVKCRLWRQLHPEYMMFKCRAWREKKKAKSNSLALAKPVSSLPLVITYMSGIIQLPADPFEEVNDPHCRLEQSSDKYYNTIPFYENKMFTGNIYISDMTLDQQNEYDYNIKNICINL